MTKLIPIISSSKQLLHWVSFRNLLLCSKGIHSFYFQSIDFFFPHSQLSIKLHSVISFKLITIALFTFVFILNNQFVEFGCQIICIITCYSAICEQRIELFSLSFLLLKCLLEVFVVLPTFNDCLLACF